MVTALKILGILTVLATAFMTYLAWPVAPYDRPLPLAFYVGAWAWLASGLVTCLILFAIAAILDGVMLIRRTLKIADSDSSTASGRYAPEAAMIEHADLVPRSRLERLQVARASTDDRVEL